VSEDMAKRSGLRTMDNMYLILADEIDVKSLSILYGCIVQLETPKA